MQIKVFDVQRGEQASRDFYYYYGTLEQLTFIMQYYEKPWKYNTTSMEVIYIKQCVVYEHVIFEQKTDRRKF